MGRQQRQQQRQQQGQLTAREKGDETTSTHGGNSPVEGVKLRFTVINSLDNQVDVHPTMEYPALKIRPPSVVQSCVLRRRHIYSTSSHSKKDPLIGNYLLNPSKWCKDPSCYGSKHCRILTRAASGLGFRGVPQTILLRQ